MAARPDRTAGTNPPRVNGTRSVHYHQDVTALAGLRGPVDGVTTALDDPSRAGAEAIAWALNMLRVSTAGSVLRMDGHMVDAPVILRAQRVLGRAKEKS
jgi:hypothetical protein